MNKHTPFSAELMFVRDIAQDTRIFRFRADRVNQLVFLAGQFFLLQVSEKINRAYSIASTPSLLPEFELIIKFVPGGAASGFLWKLKPGDKVTFRGPMGKFGIRFPEKKQIFIATGTGLAPIRAMWQTVAEKNHPAHMRLIFGVRHESNLFCLEELSQLADNIPDIFQYQICLSRPLEKESRGYFCGRVTDFTKSLSENELQGAEISLCGSKEMVAEIRNILTEKGVTKDMINVESW